MQHRRGGDSRLQLTVTGLNSFRAVLMGYLTATQNGNHHEMFLVC